MVISKIQLFCCCFVFLASPQFPSSANEQVKSPVLTLFSYMTCLRWPLTEELEGLGEEEPDCENWQACPSSGTQRHSLPSVLTNVAKYHSMQWL